MTHEAAAAGAPARVGIVDDADEAFVARLRARDPEAVRELYDRVARRAFGLAYRVLGDPAAAEDAVQEAFVGLWERAERLDAARGRVESLLLTMVHRRAVDMARARQRRVARAAPMPDDVPDESSRGPYDTVAALHSRHEVVAALDALGADQRAVVELAYFEGLTLAEVAERVGAPLGTVKSRMRLALQKIRRALGVEEAM